MVRSYPCDGRRIARRPQPVLRGARRRRAAESQMQHHQRALDGTFPPTRVRGRGSRRGTTTVAPSALRAFDRRSHPPDGLASLGNFFGQRCSACRRDSEAPPILRLKLNPDVHDLRVQGIFGPLYRGHRPSVHRSLFLRPVLAVVVVQASKKEIGVFVAFRIDCYPRFISKSIAGIG